MEAPLPTAPCYDDRASRGWVNLIRHPTDISARFPHPIGRPIPLQISPEMMQPRVDPSSNLGSGINSERRSRMEMEEILPRRIDGVTFTAAPPFYLMRGHFFHARRQKMERERERERERGKDYFLAPISRSLHLCSSRRSPLLRKEGSAESFVT